MRLLLTILLINSIWTLGLTLASQEDMLLYPLRERLEGKYWAKPFFTCVYCMPSIHSIFAYGFAMGMGIITHFSWSLVFMWPLVVCGASILNAIIWTTITLLMKKVEYYDGLDMRDFNDPNDETVIDDEPNESYYKRN